jgi:hypothetical protein
LFHLRPSKPADQPLRFIGWPGRVHLWRLPVNGLAVDGALVDQLMALDGRKNDEQWQQQKISSGPTARTESSDSPPHFASTIIQRLDFGRQIMRTDPMPSDVNCSADGEGRPSHWAGMSLSKWKISIGGSPANGRQKSMEPAVERRANHSAAIPFICHRTDGQEAPLDPGIDAEKKPTSCLLRLLLCPSACLLAVSSGGPLGGPDPVAGGGRVTRSDIDRGALRCRVS